jgi:hypothetical protein
MPVGNGFSSGLQKRKSQQTVNTPEIKPSTPQLELTINGEQWHWVDSIEGSAATLARAAHRELAF